jgi:RNA polymerase sigma-70 factor (ECF subfamily)
LGIFTKQLNALFVGAVRISLRSEKNSKKSLRKRQISGRRGVIMDEGVSKRIPRLRNKEVFDMNDKDIVALYFARDERAITESDRAHGAACRSVATGILRDPRDAEECVNDTWLKAWNAMPPHRPNSLRAFLCRITRNTALSRYRMNHREKRNRELEVALEELDACIPAPAEDGEAAPLVEVLESFLGGESELDRRLLLGRYWHGMAVKDLAAQYRLTPNAVTKRLGKTRERLRVYLNERGYSL